MPIVPLSALVFAGAALLAGSPPSASPETQPTAPAVAVAPAAASGMVVYIDPETGGLTSTPPSAEAAAELLALEAALSRSSEGLVETTASDGSPMINLQGRFQNVLMAGVSAHGPQALCTTSKVTAHAVIAPAASPAKPAFLGREEK
jgi:hypothetical protein